jgi:hypothetical protein
MPHLTDYGIYSPDQAAKLLGVSSGRLAYAVKVKNIAAGNVILPGGKRYFDTAQMQEMKDYFARYGKYYTAGRDGLYNRRQMAKILTISMHALDHWIADGQLDPPNVVKGKRKFWTPDFIQKLKKQMDERVKVDWQRKREAAGWYSICAAAAYCGVPIVTFEFRLRRAVVDRFPLPSHAIGAHRYYTQEEVDKFKAWYDKRRADGKKKA